VVVQSEPVHFAAQFREIERAFIVVKAADIA
jgi:hypothetical protein